MKSKEDRPLRSSLKRFSNQATKSSPQKSSQKSINKKSAPKTKPKPIENLSVTISEKTDVFEGRKVDHLRLSLDERNQANSLRDLDQIELIHDAFPAFNFADVDTSSYFLNHKLSVPFFISSMTAGHRFGQEINRLFLKFSEDHQVLFAVGSQRRDLESELKSEWSFRREHPRALVLANIGLAQLISHGPRKVLQLIDRIDAVGIFVHLNPLQECLQPEGTPQFRGAENSLRDLVRDAGVPVIVKEVGCGLNLTALRRLQNLGVQYFDVSGAGGTHWGRIESERTMKDPILAAAALSFRHWGQGTVQCLHGAISAEIQGHLWASGGVRTGVDVAKLLAVGAEMVGLAKPWLEALLESSPTTGKAPSSLKIRPNAEASLRDLYAKMRLELAIAMFCTGSMKLCDLRNSSKWQRKV